MPWSPIVARRITQDTRLGHREHRLVCAMLAYMHPARSNWTCTAADATLAAAAGMPPRTERKALKELRAMGYVLVSQHRLDPGARAGRGGQHSERVLTLTLPYRDEIIGKAGLGLPKTEELPYPAGPSDGAGPRVAPGEVGTAALGRPDTAAPSDRDGPIGPAGSGTLGRPDPAYKDSQNKTPTNLPNNQGASTDLAEPDPMDAVPWAKLRERWNGIAARFPGVERLHMWKVKGDRRRVALMARATSDGRSPAQVWDWICLCIEGDPFYNGSGPRRAGDMQDWRVSVAWALNESRGWLSLNEKFDARGQRTGGRGQRQGQQALFGGQAQAPAPTAAQLGPFFVRDERGDDHDCSEMNAANREQIKIHYRAMPADLRVPTARRLIAGQGGPNGGA